MIRQDCHCDIPSPIAQLIERMRSHDDVLYAHSLLVSRLTSTFAAHLGFPLRDQRLLRRAALLHDVGKLHIDRSLLHKPTTLNEREWAILRCHPTIGNSILEDEDIYDPIVRDAVQNHHERLDGTGYPVGISGKQISEVVRVITLCDVFAAMTETRAYGKPYTWSAALERMEGKSTRLDLNFLRHFVTMIEAQYVRRSAPSVAGWRFRPER